MTTTLKDIAARSGYSITTVSRALAGYSDVSQRTRQKIMEIANEIGYEPNQIARQLQQQRTNTLGLVMPPRIHSLDEDFFSLLLKGITYAAANYHYDVLVSAMSPDSSEMDAYRRIVGGNRVDGIILARTYRKDPRLAYLRALNHPFIVHGRSAPSEETDFPYIDVDSRYGIELLVSHILEAGYTTIGIILPPEEMAYTPYRLEGYQEALAKASIPFNPAYVIHSDLSYEGGLRAAQDLLKKDLGLNAIVGCNDWMALGAMTAAQEYGYNIGRNFAIAGYDDIPPAALSTPTMTTIRQPIYNIGELLTARLIQLIQGDESVRHEELILPELIIRESTGTYNP